ncbi:uncharacterized protein LOC134677771 [Cydia fagiglandana]|uniref:uncharacterized protein LOC134677771 n=1 Tax=Cydia fagiglandana TaxID=1458189 RepID=UPI002FEE2A5C
MMIILILCVFVVIMGAGYSASLLDLSVTGLPDDSCTTIDEYKINKHCAYTFSYSALGDIVPLKCTLTGILSEDYYMSFGDIQTIALKKEPVTTLPNEITLKGKNDTIECKARRKGGGFLYSVVVYFNYIPPPPTTERATTLTDKPTTIQVPSPSVLESKSYTSPAGNESPWWLKFVLGGCAVIIALCVLVCVIVYCRKKKPLPDDLTYANLTKDHNNYATLPMPTPRTLQNAKSKVTVEGTYSEPKDSQDMSEALYANPNRFKGSETYAEPYVKSGPKPCTYAEPNKADYAEPYMPKEGSYAAIGISEGGYAAIGNSEGGYAAIGSSKGGYASVGNSEGNYAEIGAKSEGNYAEIGVNNNGNKELYARPIPKAQRPFKAKDESNYSNVFKDLYANAKKK